jgi:hypothetical protein
VSSRALFAGAVLLVVFGARLLVIAHCGAAHPFQDEWVAVGERLLKPLTEGVAGPATFLSPQNEHRLLLTHLSSAALVALNGWEWDLRVGMVWNALLYALIALLLFLAADSLVGRRVARPALAAMAMVFFSLPYAWTNTVVAFSPYGLHVLCSLIAIGALSGGGSARRLAVGALFALLSILTVGSGILIPLALLAALTLQVLRTRALPVRPLGVCALLAALAYAALIHVPEHDPLRPDSLAELAAALGYALSWPAAGPALGAIGVIAFGWYCTLYLRGEVPDSASQRALLAFGAWALLHSAALALTRGEGPYIRAPRYTDFFALWQIASGLCLACALLASSHRVARATLSVLMAAWLLHLGGGLYTRADLALHQMSNKARVDVVHGQRLRAFLETRNAAVLQPPAPIPYYRADELARLLSDETIRSLLPHTLVQRAPGPLSAMVDGMLRLAFGWIGLGTALALAAGGRLFRETRRVASAA